MNLKTFVQHTHCLQATVHRDNLMVNYKFEDILFLLCGTKRFLVTGFGERTNQHITKLQIFQTFQSGFLCFLSAEQCIKQLLSDQQPSTHYHQLIYTQN